MFKNDQKIAVKQIEVEVHLQDGTSFLAMMGIGQNQRLSDTLNDDRQFLPINLSEGKTIILQKSVISKVVPLDQFVDHEKVKDPYEILGVPRNISDEDLTKSYRMMVAENHPDRVHSSGLSSQYAEMANSRMIHINDAYARIRQLRKDEQSDDLNGV